MAEYFLMATICSDMGCYEQFTGYSFPTEAACQNYIDYERKNPWFIYPRCALSPEEKRA